MFLPLVGTDRNNFVEMASAEDNFPVGHEVSTLFEGAKLHWNGGCGKDAQQCSNGGCSRDEEQCIKADKPIDVAVNLASSGCV